MNPIGRLVLHNTLPVMLVVNCCCCETVKEALAGETAPDPGLGDEFVPPGVPFNTRVEYEITPGFGVEMMTGTEELAPGSNAPMNTKKSPLVE